MARPNNLNGGRPRKEINEVLLEKLCLIQLSDKIIADILEVHPDTLHRYYSDKMEMWRSKGKSKIAEVLYDEAINRRNPRMLELIAKKKLGYSDTIKIDNTSSDGSMKPQVHVYLPKNTRESDE